MSVYKSKRGASSAQFVETARKLQVHTLEQCLKVPKRYTFYLTQKIMDHASAVYDEVTMANSIFPINQHEAQLRRDHLIAANAKLQALDRQLGLLAGVLWKNPENFKGFDNAFTVWGELIIEEAKLISGIRRSDRVRYKNLPNNWVKSCIVALSANNWWERSPNASNSTNFCNVNSNGNANNNNASNSNGVAFGFRLFPGETE